MLLLLLILLYLIPTPITLAKDIRVKGKVVTTVQLLNKSAEKPSEQALEKAQLKLKMIQKNVIIGGTLDFAEKPSKKNYDAVKEFYSCYCDEDAPYSITAGMKKYRWSRTKRNGLNRTISNQFAGEVDSRYGQGFFYDYAFNDSHDITTAITSGQGRQREGNSAAQLGLIQTNHDLEAYGKYTVGIAFKAKKIHTYEDTVGSTFGGGNNKSFETFGHVSAYYTFESFGLLLEAYDHTNKNYVSITNTGKTKLWSQRSAGARFDFTFDDWFMEIGGGLLAAFYPEKSEKHNQYDLLRASRVFAKQEYRLSVGNDILNHNLMYMLTMIFYVLVIQLYVTNHEMNLISYHLIIIMINHCHNHDDDQLKFQMIYQQIIIQQHIQRIKIKN